MPDITLRPVAPEDETFLRDVYASTREEELAQVPWTPEQIAAFLDFQFRAQTAHYNEYFPHSEHLIVLRDGEPVGRLWLDRGGEALHILDLAVLTRHRGQGTGGVILKRLMEEGAENRKPVTIHVESFSRSLGLFERLGFVRAQENGIHYLMRWEHDRQ